MRIINDIAKIENMGSCAVAIGVFDGIHAGHRKVIERAVKSGLYPAAFTFHQSPSGVKLISSGDDKKRLLEKLGVKTLISVDFSTIREMTAEKFAQDILFKTCGAKLVCCGEDFRFGKRAAGDIKALELFCSQNGAKLAAVPPVMMGEDKMSSTSIREALACGEIDRVNRALSRAWSFEADVIHGRKIGRTLGTPTINQRLPQGLVSPKFGVYASFAHIEGKLEYGVTNFGVKPTVGESSPVFETWFPKLNADLYGRRIRLYLLEFIRPEKKFSNLGELRDEIVENAKLAEKLCSERRNVFFDENPLQI